MRVIVVIPLPRRVDTDQLGSAIGTDVEGEDAGVVFASFAMTETEGTEGGGAALATANLNSTSPAKSPFRIGRVLFPLPSRKMLAYLS